MEPDWKNVNYNEGFKNVKELINGKTDGIYNLAIIITYAILNLTFMLTHN